jgi:hypothetical protein
VTAYEATKWTEFYVAAAGASAALAGLVFVAVSINVDRILKFQGLPDRALATVMLLLSVVVVSLVGLIPGQSRSALAGELLGVSLVFTVAILWLTSRSMVSGDDQRTHTFSNWMRVVLGTPDCGGGGDPIPGGRRRALLGGGRDRAGDRRRGS